MTASPRAGRVQVVTTIVAAVLGIALGSGGLYLLGFAKPGTQEASAKEDKSEGKDKEKDPNLVAFPESRWVAAGLKVEEIQPRPFQEKIRRSGRVALEEDKWAHLNSPMEGVIKEVRVRLGDQVKMGDILAVIDVRELAQAKLELFKARTVSEHAREHMKWAEATYKNTEELFKLLEAGTTPTEIDARMKDKPIGDARQALISAYVRRKQLRAQFATVKATGRDALSETAYEKLKAETETAEETYRSIAEESRHKAMHEAHLSEQKVQEAHAGEAVARTQLRILGFGLEEIDNLDPIAEGPKASLWNLKAPFDGTIIDRHAVRSERVGPQVQLFEIADLAKVRILADLFENDLPLARELVGKQILYRSTVISESAMSADVVHVGDLLDKNTRAITLTAVTANPDRKLKPGMHVEVELARPAITVLQVPPSAVFRDSSQPYVFVHEGEEKFRRIDVTLGREQDDAVEILTGLKPGQMVAIEGGFFLKTELLRDQLAGE